MKKIILGVGLLLGSTHAYTFAGNHPVAPPPIVSNISDAAEQTCDTTKVIGAGLIGAITTGGTLYLYNSGHGFASIPLLAFGTLCSIYLGCDGWPENICGKEEENSPA